MVDLESRPPSTAFSERLMTLALRSLETYNMFMIRLSHGRVGGTMFGQPVVFLTTVGRKSGELRTKPILAVPDGDAWLVAASRGGTARHPEWYRNLVAAGGAVLTFSDRVVRVRAEQLSGKAREEAWARMVAVYRRFDSYQARATEREIPVLRLVAV